MMVKVLPGGKIEDAGNSKKRNTGKWREGARPEHDAVKCINCLRCVNFCPENAIKVKDGKIISIDYNKCKGCGICANECPVGAIKMIKEDYSEKGNKKDV